MDQKQASRVLQPEILLSCTRLQMKSQKKKGRCPLRDCSEHSCWQNRQEAEQQRQHQCRVSTSHPETKRRKGRFCGLRGLRALVRKTCNALNCSWSTCPDCLPRREKVDQDQPDSRPRSATCVANTLRLWRKTLVFPRGVCSQPKQRQLLRVKVQSKISLLNVPVRQVLVDTLMLKRPKRAKSLFV
ncbi:hypothetical protein MHYP_G00344850 [Metynnis hypsauchen]